MKLDPATDAAAEAATDARSEPLIYGAPSIGEEEIAEVVACLRSGWLGTGPRVAKFEKLFAAYKGVPHAVALSSCTAALHLALIAAKIGPGDQVITTPLTFCATVNAILHAGASPVLVDVDPRTMNLDPAGIEAAITRRTRAIVPVHFAGRPCDMDAIGEIAKRHGLSVIEDCAHAIEAEWRGQTMGTFGDFGCFSFYATKNATTGEGGMLLARREEDAKRIRTLSLHGLSKDAWNRAGETDGGHYAAVECGYKYNMMDLQAALGIHQVARIETNWERRRVLAERYDAAFADLPLDPPAAPEPHSRHAYHLYPVLIDEARAGVSRDEFIAAMTGEKIGTGVHYRAVTEHPYYQDELEWRPEQTPHATAIGRRTVSLPLSPGVTDADADDVIAAVRKTLRS